MKFLINFSFQVDFFFKTKKKMICPSDMRQSFSVSCPVFETSVLSLIAVSSLKEGNIGLCSTQLGSFLSLAVKLRVFKLSVELFFYSVIVGWR